MSTNEIHLQNFLDCIYSLQRYSLTSEQLWRAISALRFCLQRFEEELQRREDVDAKRRELSQ